MKKPLLIAPIALASQLAYGAQVYLGNTTSSSSSSGNLNSTMPAARTGKYYKCANSVSFSCQTSVILISYTSQTGGTGTSTNPYILTGCAFVSCACAFNQYLSGQNGKSCNSCKNGAVVLQDANEFHTKYVIQECKYCSSGTLKKTDSGGQTSCNTCPANGTCDGSATVSCNIGYFGTTTCERCPLWSEVYGTSIPQVIPDVRSTTNSTGKTVVASCYFPAGTYKDATGTFTLSGNCWPY